MIKKFFFLTIIILSVLALFAKQRKKNIENIPLLNTKWVLEEIFEIPVFHNLDTAFIIFYENYKFSGNFGCNIFFGEFNFGKKRMKVDYQGATKKLCMDMDLEQQFAKAMRSDITHYYIDKKNLYLLSKEIVICKFGGVMIND